MHCKIQKQPLLEVVENWSIPIDLSWSKTHQFYLLAENKDSFQLAYEYFVKALSLIDIGEIFMKEKSWDINKQIQDKLAAISDGGHYALKVTTFNNSLDSADVSIKVRFGHDYDQNRIESASLKQSLSNFRGKAIIFTWIDSTSKDAVMAACSSAFKDGMCEPEWNEKAIAP
jgi:hypothetical protein